MEFSRQEYWSGLPFPPPEDPLAQGLNPGLLQSRQILYPLSHQGNPAHSSMNRLFIKQPLLTPLSLFSAETDCYDTCRYHVVRKTGEYLGDKHMYLMFLELTVDSD